MTETRRLAAIMAIDVERLGEERFLDFLNRFITDLSLAIAGAGGKSGLSIVAWAYARATTPQTNAPLNWPRWQSAQAPWQYRLKATPSAASA